VESLGNFRFVAVNQKPLEFISMINRRAVDDLQTPFALSQTLHGGFKYRSLGSLYDKISIETFHYHNRNPQESQSDMQRGDIANSIEYSKSAPIFYPLEIGAMATNMNNGAYVSTNRKIDIFNKEKTELRYAPTNINGLGNNQFLLGETRSNLDLSSSNGRQNLFHTASNAHGSNYLSFNDNALESAPFRPSHIDMLDNYRYRLAVSGRFDLEAGSIIDLSIVKNSYKDMNDPDNMIDKIRSGRHLITTMRHKYSRDGTYYLIMDVARGNNNHA
jgi:hypothetical protein